MQSGNSVRLSELMHGSVQSKDGKTLGQIRDLVVNPQSGQIEFAILSLSSVGGVSDTSTSGRETVPSNRSSNVGTPSVTSTAAGTGKLIPVPWQLFDQSHGASQSIGTSTAMGSQRLVLNIDESKLRTAPSFDAGQWNQFQTGNLDQRIYSHFGVDRSSATGTPGSSVTGQGASGTSSSSQQPYSGSSSSSSSYGSGSQPQGSSSQTGSQGSTSPQPQGSSPSPQR
jgi:sporulation protein YlmC with PRC-barrel domain